MAYRCCDCGNTFREPGTYKESREFWGAPCYEEFDCCPVCGSDEIEDFDGDISYEEYDPTGEPEWNDYKEEWE